MILKMIKCDVCDRREVETEPGVGWLGWGAIQGINLNGTENPSLCPMHLALTANFLDNLEEKE